MNAISSWVLSIAGISIIGVLIELVLPSGKTKKYVKGVFSFIVVLVIVSPLPKLLNKSISSEDIFEENAFVIQEEFVYEINKQRLEKLTELINLDLKEEGVENVGITINADIFTTEDLIIDAVFVDLKGIVINEKAEHKDIKELVSKSIKKYVNVNPSSIVFN